MKTLSIHVMPRGWVQGYNQTSDTPEVILGTQFQSFNARFEYVKYVSGVTGLTGMHVSYVGKDRAACIVSADISEEGAIKAYPAGILLCPVATGKYCWILKYGEMTTQADVSETVAEAGQPATVTTATIVLGDFIVPNISVDGGIARYERDDAADSDTNTEIIASLLAMNSLIPNIIGRCTAIGTGVQTIQFDYKY